MAFRDDDHRTRERPRWIPWWGWVLLVVGLLLLVVELIGIAYHRAGMQALREEMVAQVARGQGRSPRDLLATQPTVDQALQEKAAAMIVTWPGYLQMQAVGLEARCLSGWNAPSAEQRDREVSTFRKEMPGAIADWRTFAGRERLTLSSAGWLATNVTVDEAKLPWNFNRSPLRLETLAKALATEAWTTADPRPALADLDALAAAVEKAVRIRDFQTLHSIGEVRDESWLEAYVRGLTSDAWIGSLPNLVQEMQNALTAERLRTMADIWRDEASTSIKVPDPAHNPFGIFNLADCGRDGPYEPPPAQIRTCSITAYGSYRW